ncbi:hypothetical protein B296_00050144, partial [Ensete ventricosum]
SSEGRLLSWTFLPLPQASSLEYSLALAIAIGAGDRLLVLLTEGRVTTASPSLGHSNHHGCEQPGDVALYFVSRSSITTSCSHFSDILDLGIAFSRLLLEV